MALWREYAQKEEYPRESAKFGRGGSSPHANRESFIAPGLVIDGKIEGAGDMRVAGRFRGDVHVEGELTIEPGGHVTGDVRAETVRVGGEVHGNVHASSRVELLESGTLIGDLMTGSLTAAAGSRMRGKVEFGWNEHGANKAVAMEEDEASL
ncbi:MAG: polymer-forming cytoskeletal protein [Candidatus Methylomirabilales bacterium]